MSALTSRTVAPRRVSPEPLNVATALVGRPLASPLRRALAMGLDLLVVALLSGASGLWLGLGLLAVAWQLRGSAAGSTRTRLWAGRALVTLFVLLAALEAWDGLNGRAEPADADETPAAAVAASAPAPAASESSETASDAATGAASAAAMQHRIEQLEAELAAAREEARKPRPLKWRDELRRLLDAVGASFGWGVVYFSLLPAFWNGQTLGKRLLRLQVVELTGKPMTVMRCLRRYDGYTASIATNELGFAQTWWDLNHQGIQDRTAHTVVLDLREDPALSLPEQTAPAAEAAAEPSTAPTAPSTDAAP